MVQFTKPNAALIMSDHIMEEHNAKDKYAHFDRAFIVTDEKGCNNLLAHASEFFAKESLELFGDFIATKDMEYIVSVQWSILEAFLRSSIIHIKNGRKNIPHLVYDLLSNPTYKRYFHFVSCDDALLRNMEAHLDNNTYDLLSLEDICNLDTDIAIQHITIVIKINCDKETFNHFYNNMNYRSCIQSAYKADRMIVPMEVLNNNLLKEFKNACNNLNKIYKALEKDNYAAAQALLPGSTEREFTFEITIAEFINFANQYVNSFLEMSTMEIKCINYLMCSLITDTFSIFILDRLDDFKALLGKDANAIADAITTWNNV